MISLLLIGQNVKGQLCVKLTPGQDDRHYHHHLGHHALRVPPSHGLRGSHTDLVAADPELAT